MRLIEWLLREALRDYESLPESPLARVICHYLLAEVAADRDQFEAAEANERAALALAVEEDPSLAAWRPWIEQQTQAHRERKAFVDALLSADGPSTVE